MGAELSASAWLPGAADQRAPRELPTAAVCCPFAGCRQGDLEKQNGLPISPLMDRDLPGVTNPKNCVGVSCATQSCNPFASTISLVNSVAVIMDDHPVGSPLAPNCTRAWLAS